MLLNNYKINEYCERSSFEDDYFLIDLTLVQLLG